MSFFVLFAIGLLGLALGYSMLRYLNGPLRKEPDGLGTREEWVELTRHAVRQRDKFERELHALQRKRAHERQRTLYWLTRERATRRYVQDMLRTDSEAWSAQVARVEKVRWN